MAESISLRNRSSRATKPHLRHITCERTGVHVLTPVLPLGTNRQLAVEIQKYLLTNLLERQAIDNYIAWYYTPMAMEFTSGLTPDLTIYDCMDELSAFAGAPPRMLANRECAVPTCRSRVHRRHQPLRIEAHTTSGCVCLPEQCGRGSLCKGRGRSGPSRKTKQFLPRPRLGYAGVIDERIDTTLIEHLAKSHPNWHIVMVGPVVKIPLETLPRRLEYPLSGDEEL